VLGNAKTGISKNAEMRQRVQQHIAMRSCLNKAYASALTSAEQSLLKQIKAKVARTVKQRW
jgi:hypothetical protein